MEILGRNWLLLHGYRREYQVGKRSIDIAHPKKKIALEGDGDKYHINVVNEIERNRELENQGWTVLHFRYPQLKNHPSDVRRKVKAMHKVL